jgi:hypothetical protein
VSFTGSSAALCSELCVLGGDPANPAGSPSCGGPAKGLCIFRPAPNGAGDYGYCTAACEKQDDCQNPAFFCMPEMGLTGTTGVSNGFCFNGTPCPKGASDCAAIPMSACTATKYGPICLTSDFPLGSAAPVDGGADGGGDSGTDSGSEGGTSDSGTADSGITSDSGTDDASPDAGTDGG